MEICMLKKQDYAELITFFNEVFGHSYNAPQDFERDLPKMCVADDEHMGKHIGVKEDGKLVAALGIYPLPSKVGGEEILFSTVGNIATHWEYTGRGYMDLLIHEAMKRLEGIGADASRLCGLRSRYARFGYEICGYNYSFTMFDDIVNKYYPNLGPVEFKEIGVEDLSLLDFCKTLSDQDLIMVERSAENGYFDVYASMIAWGNKPYIALDEQGEKIGYLCVNSKGNSVAEFYAVNCEAAVKMLVAWQKKSKQSLNIILYAYQTELIRKFSKTCESIKIYSPSQFKILNFQKMANAFLKLKASYAALPQGELVLNIEDYGKIRLFVEGNNVGCETTDRAEDLTLNKLQATRFLFGPLPPSAVADAPAFAQSVLPLPLSWNSQNRV